MNRLLNYSGIITKVKAMQSNLITKTDFERIANLESISDFITYLKNHKGYHSIFYNMDEHLLHRGQVEGVFINALYRDFSSVYNFANMEQRYALDLTFFRYEINVLKTCIQLVYNKDSDTYDLSTFYTFFEHHSKLNISALAASQSMEEFVDNLKGTEYYSLFNHLQNRDNITSFDYEMQLDIYYFKKMWKLKDKKLKGDNLKVFTHRLGSEIDILNIMWLYRSKRFFNIHTTDSYSYVIPIHYKLKNEQLMKLIEASSIDEFIARLNTTYYKKISSTLLDGTMEIYYQKIMLSIAENNAARYSSSMAPVYAYLLKKQIEIKRLTTALECIRYKLEPEDTLRYVLQ